MANQIHPIEPLYLAGIYCISNRVTGELYVGATFGLQSRTRGHINQLRGAGKHKNKKMMASCREHGISVFTYEFISFCPQELEGKEKFAWLNERERFYVALFDPAFNHQLRKNDEKTIIWRCAACGVRQKADPSGGERDGQGDTRSRRCG